MNRETITLLSKADREKAKAWVDAAPQRTRVTFKGWKRTLDQNERMWSLLSDIAQQVEWHGAFLDKNDWKIMFVSALQRESRTVPAIEGEGYVELNRSTSDLSKVEMTDLMTLIEMFGAKHEVKFKAIPEIDRSDLDSLK